MLKLQRQLLKTKCSFSSNLLKPNTTASSSLRKFSQNILARQVSIETVKQLRKETEAPLGQIRKALEESNGDIELAKEWLRKKGVQTAQKKATREAANGLVSLRISEDKKLGVAVEVNSETDFVAMNEKFKQMVSTITTALLNHYNKPNTKSVAQIDVNEVKDVKVPQHENRSVQQVITDLVGAIGENLVLRRVAILRAGENQQICQYVHNDNGEGAGSIGTLVSVSFKGEEFDAEDMEELGRQVAMHVTGAMPQYYSLEQIPKETLEKEKEAIKNAIIQEFETVTDEKKKKSLQHLDKMVDGKLNKHLSQNILLEQPWAMDGKTPVKTHLAEHNMNVHGFLRFKCGTSDVSFYSDKI